MIYLSNNKSIRTEEKANKKQVCMIMDEYDGLLLSTVRKGDVNLLKSYLSSILDPDLYLNRVYDESNEQKCTLLMIACLAGYEDIVCMLLDCFKPDLEVLNVIQINDNDSNSEIYQNVTVLWAAAAVDNFSIVKQLVKHGANVNHTTNTNSTPVRCACYCGNLHMVIYLVENGADIHVNKKNNETNLALSVYCKHLTVTAYLVDDLGCNVNECDSYGRLPLHFAVKCESLDIVNFLLNREAKNFPTTYDQMSPLMLAAEKRCSDIMKAIGSHCSIAEQIEAEELLGSAFACAELGSCDLQQSYEHFYRALELRSTHNLPKVLRDSTSEAFNNRQECQTINQLKELRLNLENMYTEALLVRERLLGPTSEKYRYSLIYRGAILAEDEQFHQTIVLWLYELGLRQQYSLVIDRQRLRRFTSIFAEMVNASLSVSIKAILTVIAATIEKVKHNTEDIDFNLHTLLFLITIASQVQS
jgi:Fem-1 family protein b